MSRHSESVSMDDYSHIEIADKSSKFRKSPTSSAGYEQKQSRRRGRSNFQLSGNRQKRGINSSAVSVSAGSVSTRRSTMEEDMMRLYPERFENEYGSTHSREYRSPEQKHSPRKVPALESLLQKPKPNNADKNPKHRSMEVVLGNGKSKKKATKKNKSNGMGKLKKLNCFSSSNRPQYDDAEALRQQAVIAREHYGKVVSKIDSKDFHCADEDNYGEGNSLAAGMSVITVGSKSCYKDTARSISSRTTTRHRNDKPGSFATRGRKSHAKDILEDLREEELEMNSGNSTEERAGSFINLSVSDIEEQLERRESTPTSTMEQKRSEELRHQEQIHLQMQNAKRQQRLSATTSVVQGVVTPPRGAASTSYIAKPSSKAIRGDSFEEPSLTYTYHSGSPMHNTSLTSQTSYVNLARDLQQQQQQPRQQAIGPRCHFCGGPHWIYNCPHMDESSQGRRRRAEGHVYDDASASLTTTTGGSTTTSDSNASSVIRCGKNQSNPLECQVCLKHVAKAIATTIENNR